MPEQQQIQTQPQLHQLLLRVGLFSLIAIVVVGALVYFGIALPTISKKTSSVQNQELSPTFLSILSSNRSGDYADAAAQYESIGANGNATSEEKATAIFVGLGARYRNSADFDDYVKDLEDLKTAIIDPAVSERMRVNALNMLGSAFCRSGRSEKVVEEIYKGETFSAYLVPGDPNLSARKLFDWSYGIYPTPKAAVRIARWYIEEALWKTSLSQTTRNEYISQAITHANAADELARRDLQKYGSIYLDSSQHASYWYWRAVNQGGLAQLGVEPYSSTYKQAYQDFFNFVEKQNNVGNKQYLPYGYLFYADALVKVDNDTAAARDELQKAVDFVTEDTEVNEFALFLKNEGSKPAWDYSSQAMYDMEKISPIFKSLKDALVKAE